MKFTIHNGATTPFIINIGGRKLWALEALMTAGERGCTPIDRPAPRWSAYIEKLRRLGVDIITIRERHGGPFAGNHGRYVLRSRVTRNGGPNDARC